MKKIVIVIASIALFIVGFETAQTHASWQTPTNSSGVLVNSRHSLYRICDSGNLIYISEPTGGTSGTAPIFVVPKSC